MSRLPDIIRETKEDMTNNGVLGGIVGHVGDGNFHSTFLNEEAKLKTYSVLAILLFNEAERHNIEEVVHRMVKRAIEMEGTATGEHGVGIIKRDVLPHELGESTVDAMRRVRPQAAYEGPEALTLEQLKQAFDPLCLLNCDKIVRMEPPAKGEVPAW